MTRAARTSLLSMLFLVMAGASACGPNEESEEDPEGECQVNADCPGADNICDLLTNECSKGMDPTDTGERGDTGGGTRDTGTEDTLEPDTGVPPEDTGADTREPNDTGTLDTGPPEDTAPPEDTHSPEDTSPVDTGRDTGRDTGVDTGTDTAVDANDGGNDTGPPAYSGCTSDSDCSGYLECDTTLGRCEDPRTKCESNSDCSSNQACIFGHCADDCTGFFSTCPRTGLSCETFSSGGSSADFCVNTCDTFDGSGTDACGEDTQCVPFFGSGEGLCRGTGQNKAGDSCKTNYGTDACTEGNLCTNNRGEKTCKSLCSSSGNPGCGSSEYCDGAFAYDRSDQQVADPAGVCRTDCGGLGSTNSGICSGTKQCQPDSANHGFCTKAGSASADQDCGYPGSPYCEVGNYCMRASAQGKGICRALCNPSNSQNNNNCSPSQACVEISSNFGICLTMCSNTGSSSNNNCPSERPYCGRLRNSVNTTPSTPGACFVD